MLPQNQKFYRPYESYEAKSYTIPKFLPYESESDAESEASDTDSGTVTTTTSSKENLPNFVEFATNLELNEAGGQNFPTIKTQLDYGLNEIRKDTGYAPYQNAFSIDLMLNSKQFDVSGSNIFKDPNPIAKQNETSVIMLNSRDRDRNVYPTPSFLTLRLPRVYQNITSLQVLQMKLLSSFLYFRADKNNICMTINEFGRLNWNYLNFPNAVSSGPLNVRKCIREGSYNINSLIAELNIQLNTPPLFYDYPNGFNQFVPLFVATGDFSLAFNYPGEYFYDSLNRTYTAAPSRTFITTRFWPSTNLGFTPTLKQTKVAYYYPVLREYVLDPQYGIDKLDTNIDTSFLLPDETIYTRIVYAFQGVDDPIIQEMIDANLTALDIYRSANTFRQSLANRYVVSYETFNNRIFIQSPSLNTSLVNLLNTQSAIFLAQILLDKGLTAAQYAALQTANSQILSVLNSMYEYIQTQLAIYFGINFNTFAPVYFTQPNNYVNVQNALNAIGVSSNYDANVITNPNNPFSNNIIEINRQQPTFYWPNMSNLSVGPLGMLGYPENLGPPIPNCNSVTSNYPYEIALDNFVFNTNFVDAQGDVYIDLGRNAGDILVPLQASRYTVFKFRSLYRQTLQVETLPRPTQYRYPDYNVYRPYSSDIIQFFDNSYSFVYATPNMDNVPEASLCNIYGYNKTPSGTTSNFAMDLSQALVQWGTNRIVLSVANSLYPFMFSTPYPVAPAAPAYKYELSIGVFNYDTSNNIVSSSNLPSELDLFLYHDRAAFMADVFDNPALGGNRQENPLHYTYSNRIPTTSPSNVLTFDAYAGQTYYAILRSASLSFTSLTVQIPVWFPNGSTFLSLSNDFTGFDPFGNPNCNLNNWLYARTNDPDFIRLPVQSNLWGVNPTGNEVNKGLVISNVPIGYDSNGVSTDLTDYAGFKANSNVDNLNPLALIRCDPISGYFFQTQSTSNYYSPSAQSYFYPGSSNNILTPVNQSNYTPGIVPYRQFKIVQWYDTTYIPDPTGTLNPFIPADVSPYIDPYTSNTTISPISNYEYDIASGNINLGLGCCGFSFAPSDGVWSIDKVMFRSAFLVNDLNDNIAYLKVFLTSQANAIPTFELPSCNAVAKLLFTKKTVYADAGDVNFGFDGLLGTYYEFDKDPSFVQSPISGFDQNADVLYTNANSYYSVLPFDSNDNLVFMRALTGTPVPYPYVTDASASVFYYDGNRAPNRRGIVIPQTLPPSGSPFGPPAGIPASLSAYEQSIPIGTQILHFQSQTNLVEDSNAFYPWSGPGYVPSQIFADVSGTMMVQSTDFKFYSYPIDTGPRQFTYLFSLTVDEIFPAAESTLLVAAAGNSTKYAFLGFKTVGGVFQIRIKTYDVELGILSDVGVPATYTISDLGFNIKTFCFTDTNGFVISGSSSLGLATTYRTPNLSTPLFTDTFVGYNTVQSIQAPVSDTIYSLPLKGNGESDAIYYSVKESQSQASQFTNTIQTGNTTPSTYTNLAVTYIPGIGDQLLFLSSETLIDPLVPYGPSRFYKLRQVAGTAPNFTATMEYSDFIFRDANGNPYVPITMVGGALGSKWAFFGSLTYIWGNRNDNQDAPILVQNAWQIFYPTTKVVLRKLANEVNSITDLSGLEYPEFPHTQMFVYNTRAAYLADISNNKWGFEVSGGTLSNILASNSSPAVQNFSLNSNGYLVSDVNFSGYYFNSYIFNVPLLPNTASNSNSMNITNPEDFYYLVVRNYTPSEKSQVLLRFNMPQRYDFGFVRLRDLSNEPIFATSNINIFNPSYYSALLGFQSNFQFSNVNFGYNPSQNIPGSNLTSLGFGDFLRQYRRLFGIYNSNVQILNDITTFVATSMSNFVQSNLYYILPDYARSRQNYTEALQFSILWRSALTPRYLAAEDDWGLGYNLGYAKRDTPYATIARAESFYKILDDYIYLKLNTEYDMNRLDFGGKENLKETNEPTGSVLGYNGKLLLNTFGSYAQTIVQNPVYFNPPLLKLDKLTFQWFDTAGTAITNAECEWNAAIQIVEQVPKVDIRGRTPVIVPGAYGPASSDFQDTGRNVRFGNE
jgi:hypothetical protein